MVDRRGSDSSGSSDKVIHRRCEGNPLDAFSTIFKVGDFPVQWEAASTCVLETGTHAS